MINSYGQKDFLSISDAGAEVCCAMNIIEAPAR
jgi:hypothetical protein